MKFLLLAIALMQSPAPAYSMPGDYIYRDPDGDTVVIHAAPCTAVKDRIDPPSLPYYRAATAVVEGKTYAGCWTMITNDLMFVGFENGGTGYLSRKDFKPKTEL